MVLGVLVLALVLVSWLLLVASVVLRVVLRRVIVSEGLACFGRYFHIEVVVVSLAADVISTSTSASACASTSTRCVLVVILAGRSAFIHVYSFSVAMRSITSIASATALSTSSACSARSTESSATAYLIGGSDSVHDIFSGFFLLLLFGLDRWSFFFGLWLLVSDLVFVDLVFGEDAVERSDSAWLLNRFQALDLWLVNISNHHTVDFVKLV